MPWWLLLSDAAIVAAVAAMLRWLLHLQHRTDDHAERISHLEGPR